MPTPRLTDMTGVAEYIGRSKGAVRGMVDRRQIPYVKTGGRVMFDLRKIDEWIEVHTVDVAA